MHHLQTFPAPSPPSPPFPPISAISPISPICPAPPIFPPSPRPCLSSTHPHGSPLRLTVHTAPVSPRRLVASIPSPSRPRHSRVLVQKHHALLLCTHHSNDSPSEALHFHFRLCFVPFSCLVLLRRDVRRCRNITRQVDLSCLLPQSPVSSSHCAVDRFNEIFYDSIFACTNINSPYPLLYILSRTHF